MFTDVESLKHNEGWTALMYCIKHDVCISGSVAEFLVDECYEHIVDEGYMDFAESSRWNISKYYIFNFDGDYYRLWQEVGLTEMQPSEYYDQTLELVHMKEVTITTWVTDDEEDSIYG